MLPMPVHLSQGTLTCCCNACKFSLSGFMFLTTSCNICNCFRTVGLQIWKEIHPRPNKSTSSKLKSSHPFLKIHRTSVVFHELHESIQDHCLRSLDEMWSQESFEIARAVIWVLSTTLCSVVFCTEMLHLLIRSSIQVPICKVAPIINCIFESKETGPSIISRGYLRGHLLSHVYCWLLGCSSHCIESY